MGWKMSFAGRQVFLIGLALWQGLGFSLPSESRNSLSDQQVPYRDGQVVELETPLLHVTEVVILPGDRIDSIQGGDSSSWLIAVSQQHRDRFFLKAKRAHASSNFLIEGRRHDYWLHAREQSDKTDPVYRLRWVLPMVHYKKSTHYAVHHDRSPILPVYAMGDRHLRPTWFYTDKISTYFHWPAGRSLPAVYASDWPHGPFHLINFRMHRGVMEILEKAPYWRLVSGSQGCLVVTQNKALLKKESSVWHHFHCLEDVVR